MEETFNHQVERIPVLVNQWTQNLHEEHNENIEEA
jgi:hypothetical protein